MTVAERTREAVRERPFLHDALAAGVVNYTAAARHLDVGDEETVAAALRRYARELEADRPSGTARVRMHRGVRRVEADETPDTADTAEPADPAESGLLAVGGTGFVPGDGSLTAVLATGTVAPLHLRRILGRCENGDVTVVAAGVTDSALLVVIDSNGASQALRIVEDSVRDS